MLEVQSRLWKRFAAFNQSVYALFSMCELGGQFLKITAMESSTLSSIPNTNLIISSTYNSVSLYEGDFVRVELTVFIIL